MNLRITGYDREVDRGDPEGMHVTYDMDSDRPITSLTFWLDDSATPIETVYPVKKGSDGRYLRGLNFKPTITGEFHFHLLITDDQGDSVEAVSETKVKVTGGEVITDGDPMEDLSNLYDLIRQTRIDLFPDLYNPGHPEASSEGFLRLDRIAEGLHNAERGKERGAEWAKEVARRAKEMYPSYNIGLAEAKAGSDNHGGATDKYKLGFVTDIYVLGDNGAHWDFQIDSGGAGLPSCSLEEDEENWEKIKPRFVPIEEI